MALYNGWTAVLGTSTSITNIQSINISVGRRTASESWPVSSAEIVAWYPTGYSTPLANTSIGKRVAITAPGRSTTCWVGLVKDISLEVGIPWDSGTTTGNADFLRISCEGYGAALGRYDAISRTATVVELPKSIMDDLKASPYNLQIGYSNFSGWADNYDNAWKPATYSFQPWQLLQQISILTNSQIVDGVDQTRAAMGSGNQPAVWMTDPNINDKQINADDYKVAPVAFSDTANNATNRIYDELTFNSLAENYYTQTTINDQYADYTYSSGTAPYRTFYTQTPPNTDATYGANCQGQAEWFTNIFDDPDLFISSISATANNQQTNNLDALGLVGYGNTPAMLATLVAHAVNVTFRGTTRLCQIEGITVSGDTSASRFTYYLSDAAAGWPFKLNNANFGVLDQNRLGRYN